MNFLFHFILLTSASLYVILIVSAFIHWTRKENLSSNPSGEPPGPVYLSVLIPFRNEAHHVPALLSALENQTLNTGHWECIFIDDHSTDEGPGFIHRIGKENIRVIFNPGTGKKSAIASAIPIAKGNFIVQTDADCVMGKDWLLSIYNRLLDADLLVLAGPVCINKSTSLLSHFQSFDFIAFMGITHLGIRSRLWFLANGANLIYNKGVYETMDTSEFHYGLASGDDMFLIQAAARINKEKIVFLKDSLTIVKTQAIADFRTFIHQRLRWGSKTGKLKDWKIKVILGITLLFSLLLAGVSIAALLIKGWWPIAGILWVLKGSIDFIYLKKLAPFFNQKIPLAPYLLCTLIYPFYLTMIFILSIFKRNYVWKGREIR